jgi:hypothetical protein
VKDLSVAGTTYTLGATEFSATDYTNGKDNNGVFTDSATGDIIYRKPMLVDGELVITHFYHNDPQLVLTLANSVEVAANTEALITVEMYDYGRLDKLSGYLNGSGSYPLSFVSATATSNGYANVVFKCEAKEEAYTLTSIRIDSENYETNQMNAQLRIKSVSVTVEEIPEHEHVEETVVGKPATCTETGLTDGVKCSVCGKVLTAQQEIPALGHEYGDLIAKVKATAEADGMKAHYFCDVCDTYFDANKNQTTAEALKIVYNSPEQIIGELRVGEDANTILFYNTEIGVEKQIKSTGSLTATYTTEKAWGSEAGSLKIVTDAKSQTTLKYDTLGMEYNDDDYVTFYVYS